MDPRRDRGTALTTTLFFIIVLSAAALALASVSQSSATRASSERDLDEAAAIGEAGIAFVTEQWRAFPDAGSAPTKTGFLAVNFPNASGWADVANGVGHDSPNLGKWFNFGTGRGRFTVIAVQDTSMGGGGKAVRILAQFNKTNYTWEALLSPNATSPIQGVGTQNSQTWSGGSPFGSLDGGNEGAVFSNGSLNFSGAGTTITGTATAHGTVSATGGATVTGASTNGAATITFPDAQTIVNNANTSAQAVPPANWWNNQTPQTVIQNALNGTLVANRPPIIELQTYNPTAPGWSNVNGKETHLLVKGGGTLVLPGNTNYAFGRLVIDGSTVVITAPPGGGTLLMPDISLQNGARLILDTSGSTGSPPLTILNQGNNQYAGGFSGNVSKYDANTNTFGAPTSTSTAITGASSSWQSSSGKPNQGNGGYDEWQVNNNSFLATVTSAPTAQGAMFYNTAGTDFVMNNGGFIMGGIQTSNLTTLETGTMSAAQALFTTPGAMNPTGFVGWSGGNMSSSSARFNINAHGGSPAASGFGGLTYGAYDGVIGPNGTLTGAFVGSSMNVSSGGSVFFDQRLQALLTAPAPNTQHVMAKMRINNPTAAVLALIP